MRLVTYGGAVSLDGFLADASDGVDWLHFSKDVQQEMASFWKEVDAVLFGRKTWMVAMGMHAGGPPKKKTASSASASTSTEPAPAKPKRPKPPKVRSYVFSHTLKDIDKPGVELIRGDAVEFVRDLKRQPGKRICLMGGGELAQSLIGAGLVDEVGLNIHPILLGAGVPAFRDPGHRVKLTMKECRPLDGGCVLVKYDVLK